MGHEKGGLGVLSVFVTVLILGGVFWYSLSPFVSLGSDATCPDCQNSTIITTPEVLKEQGTTSSPVTPILAPTPSTTTSSNGTSGATSATVSSTTASVTSPTTNPTSNTTAVPPCPSGFVRVSGTYDMCQSTADPRKCLSSKTLVKFECPQYLQPTTTAKSPTTSTSYTSPEEYASTLYQAANTAEQEVKTNSTGSYTTQSTTSTTGTETSVSTSVGSLRVSGLKSGTVGGKSGYIIKEPTSFSLELDATGATSVDFYREDTSGKRSYLGAGVPDGNRYKREVSSTASFPNGEQRVLAMVRSTEGVRITNPIYLTVAMTVVTEKNEDALIAAIRSEIETNPSPTLSTALRDQDKDGVSDDDEKRFGTNPLLADSDSDGFLDGDEIKSGFNPLQFSNGDKSDRIRFESPKEVHERFVRGEVAVAESVVSVKDERFKVKKIERIEKEPGKVVSRLSGTALPNTFVTVYIYSDPIIVTVKTDTEGNWVYDLEKDLEDGQHEVYVAVTDNVGKISAQSEPLAFVKTAQAITVEEAGTLEAQAAEISPVERNQTVYLLAAIGGALAAIFLVMFLVYRQSRTPITFVS